MDMANAKDRTFDHVFLFIVFTLLETKREPVPAAGLHPG
jgi:hypothetical protein